MEKNTELNLILVARGRITDTKVEKFNVNVFDENYNINITNILELEIKKIAKLNGLIQYCGGEGYKFFKKETEELCGYKVVKNFFPVEEEYNFYYFVYRDT